MSKVAVIAVGGNALIVDNNKVTIEDQYQAVLSTSKHLVDFIQQGWTVVLTHGNGPQVGYILQRAEAARGKVHPVPMDVAVADTQGAIGYHFQQAMQNEFARRNMSNAAVTVITQMEVDAHDPAFANPTKPIGSFLDEATARERQAKEGWQIMEDAGRGWRRVVPSPRPQKILEFQAIVSLVQQGFSVVASGGGGIPVIQTPEGYKGVAAVIDKDLASSLLAEKLKADLLLISTGVEQVCLNFGNPDQQQLAQMTVSQAKQYLSEGHFKPGSMKPKVEAAVAFVERTQGRALITDPPNMARALAGETGTEIVAG